MKGTLAVIVGAFLIFAPFSLLMGWNLLTLLLFWFVIVPWIAIFLPAKISRNKGHLTESLAGLILFYAFMVFLIYEHYQSDYFFVMMASCLVNAGVVTVISLRRTQAA